VQIDNRMYFFVPLVCFWNLDWNFSWRNFCGFFIFKTCQNSWVNLFNTFKEYFFFSKFLKLYLYFCPFHYFAFKLKSYLMSCKICSCYGKQIYEHLCWGIFKCIEFSLFLFFYHFCKTHILFCHFFSFLNVWLKGNLF